MAQIKSQLLELFRDGNIDVAFNILMDNFRNIIPELKDDPEYCIVVASLLIETNQLEEALKRLPERERTIMVLYYHENMTFKEIGETANISESRVCQIHAQAIMKLKNLLSENRSNRLRQSII